MEKIKKIAEIAARATWKFMLLELAGVVGFMIVGLVIVWFLFD